MTRHRTATRTHACSGGGNRACPDPPVAIVEYRVRAHPNADKVWTTRRTYRCRRHLNVGWIVRHLDTTPPRA